MDDLALAAALGAGGGGGEGKGPAAPLDTDLAAAVAVGADLRGGTRRAAGTVAVVAGFGSVEGDLLLTAEGRLLKADGNRRPQGVALHGAAARTAGAAAEAAPEEGAEDIAQVDVAHVKPAEAAKAAPGSARAEIGIHTRMAELVVAGALILVGQYLVGLIGLLEFSLGGLVAGVQIRVVLLGLFPVGLLDLLVRGALGHAEDFIIISFLFWHRVLSPLNGRNGRVWGPPPTA